MFIWARSWQSFCVAMPCEEAERWRGRSKRFDAPVKETQSRGGESLGVCVYVRALVR